MSDSKFKIGDLVGDHSSNKVSRIVDHRINNGRHYYWLKDGQSWINEIYLYEKEDTKMTKKEEVTYKDRYNSSIELGDRVHLIFGAENLDEDDDLTVIAFTKNGDVIVEGSYGAIERFDPKDLDIGKAEKLYVTSFDEFEDGQITLYEDDFRYCNKCDCGVVLISDTNKVSCPKCLTQVELKRES